MSVEEILSMIETSVAGLEERIELEVDRKSLIDQIALMAEANALMRLRIAIVERMQKAV